MIGYGLMLAVMMYNGYMTIAVAIGAGIGYFLFGQTLLKINKENCAVKKESLCFTSCRENGKYLPLIAFHLPSSSGFLG